MAQPRRAGQDNPYMTPVSPSGYPIVQTLNRIEPPVNPPAAAVVDPSIISDTLWCASPAGQVGPIGRSMQTFGDATKQERQDCADAAQPLP